MGSTVECFCLLHGDESGAFGFRVDWGAVRGSKGAWGPEGGDERDAVFTPAVSVELEWVRAEWVVDDP